MKTGRICSIIFLCMLLLISGCAKNSVKTSAGGQEAEDVPVIHVMSMGNEPDSGMEAVYEKLDPITKDELGVIVRVSFYEWGDETDLMKRLVASKHFDIYVYGKAFDSENMVGQRVYLDLKPYLDKVPDLMKFYEDANVDLSNFEINGGLYVFPRIFMGGGHGFFYREDLRKKWGLEPIVDFKTVEAYLYRTAQEYPTVAPINDRQFFSFLWEIVCGEKYTRLSYELCVEKENPEVILSILDTPEFLEIVKIAQRWYNDGIIANDILYLQSNNTMNTKKLMIQDKAAAEFCNHYMGITYNYVMPIYQAHPDWELGWLDYNLMNQSVYTDYLQSKYDIGLAASSNCKDPETVVKLLEKMHTDQRYYNLIMYGREGINYHLNEEGKISYQGIDAGDILRGQIGLESDTMQMEIDYGGNWNAVDLELKEKREKMAQKNGTSPLCNFEINSGELPDCADEVSKYIEEDLLILKCGISENPEEELKKIRTRLDELGYREVMQSVQEQLQENQESKIQK